MKLFKRHKTKDITVGIRECRTCENNIRCEECAYPKENEMLKAEIEESRIAVKSYKGKYESAVKTAKELQTVVAEKDAVIDEYDKEIERLKTAYIQVSMDREEAVTEAVKEFWSKLKTHSRKMQSSDFSGEFWDEAILVADGDNILEEMVGE